MSNPNLRTSPSGPEFAIDLGGFTLLRVTRYTTASGAQNHICQSDAAAAYIEGGGSGGAGGGADAGVGQTSLGFPASSGGAFEDFILLNQGLTLSFSVGAGGIPVTGLAGGNGNSTTVTYGTLQWTANGGLGGAASPPTGTGGTDPLFLSCVDGGTATSNSPTALLVKGSAGCFGVRDILASGLGGNGGSSSKAPGGTGASGGRNANASANGQAGQLGSGGGGAINSNNNPAAGNIGGAGGTGYFFVWEFALAAA